MPRGEDAKRHSLLRLMGFDLFRNIVDNLSLNLRNILISPLEGEKKFLSELCELRNFREGYNLKYSCRNSNFNRRLYFLKNINYNSDMFHHDKNNKGRLGILAQREAGFEASLHSGEGIDSVVSFALKSKNLTKHENNLPRKELSALVPQYLSNFSETVFSRFTSPFSLNRKVAFTLAEVLITLGIIGIVAAITLPNIIYNYQKHVVETRLQKFYSTINQAVRLTEQDYGDRENWAQQGNQNEIEFINKYYVPYLNVIKTKKIAWNKPYVLYFEDGSALGHSGWGRDWLFFPGDPEKCLKQEKYIGRCAFSFYFNPIPGLYRENNFEPFSFAMTNNDDFIRNDSVRGCNNNGGSGSYCTKLIQRNGWKIPKDYPYRIRF